MNKKKNHYQLLLAEKTSGQLAIWKESDKPVHSSDVYKFLHTLFGTAGTINMPELSECSAKLIKLLSTDRESEFWETSKLYEFLSPIHTLLQKNMKADKNGDSFDIADDQPLILIIDEDVSFLIYLKAELEKEGWAVIVTSTIDKAFSLFYDLHPDCVIANNSYAMEFITQVQDSLSSQLVPFIILSSSNEKLERMKSYQLGADDFIVKPVEIDELFVRISRQLKKRKQFNESLLKDELTTVYNRKFLLDVYQRICLEHVRNHAFFSLIMIDLDHFKKINDTYGHLTGDKVLKEFASMLKNELSSQDVIIRFGGEEFILILPYTKAGAAEKIIGSLLQHFSESLFSCDEETFFVTFSAGIYETDGSVRLEDALKKADSALYSAKEKGRARFEVAFEQLDKKRKLKVALIDDSDVMRKMLQNFMSSLEVDQYDLDVKAFENGLVFFHDHWHDTADQYLIILDGVLPKMDGTEVLQKLRSYRDSTRYTVLMLTGRKAESDIVRALSLGADDYMTKPFSIRELEARIKILLQRMR
ncbi:diguanylate cyclase [Fictibacillus aquaticus]|uniref:Diguanylate cyclase n=1 Tax=Fictibacillus aquaticus TaxID=2021314 RepID=A0A235FBD7_9BACL|nr:diguanylate cyclase [Fictibacillus aquaticus]OYD58621.1 hypothetical protein CGZ90_01590 [Fictibacillus aquaticus]